MKSILMSIRPKWVEKIASGEKTVEVRKTVPKCGTPFKCYIYETKAQYVTYQKGALTKYGYGKGKVVGEFVCDYVQEFESEFVDDECYESVALVEYDEDDGERETIIMVDNEDEHYENRYPFKETCLSWEELKKYIGIGIKTFYGWHISDLKIYDKPKKLSKFRKPCAEDGECCNCKNCMFDDKLQYYTCKDKIYRPPQSWCYVEELD